MRGARCQFLAFRVLCAAALFSAGCLAAGCAASSGAKIITIWTDQSVVALYAAYFNAVQDAYHAEVVYVDRLAERLVETERERKDSPDIVIGNWLNSAGTIALFRPIASFYQGDAPLESVFYPGLLEGGQLKSAGSRAARQVLLPVSFDAQILAFDRHNAALLPDPFTISLAELRETGAAYNLMQDGVLTRVGFSPLWNEAFLFASTALLGADWREAAARIAWDEERLQAALETLREWAVTANGSIQAGDDFYFKYFFAPPDKLVADGRILFAVMRASDFFKLTEERRASLDFRWLEHEGRIVPSENIVYYGACRKSDSRAKAIAFTNWFFSEESQSALLAKDRATRNTLFGIAGGFSAMRGVTETAFPRSYAGMLGHAPPGEKLVSPGVFPPFFPELKERVIIPCLREQTRLGNDAAGNNDNRTNADTLESRLSDWTRME